MIKEKDTNHRILDAALKEFSTYGFSGARMDRIAKTAKINKAMIFYYFSSKETLYQLVIRKAFQKIYPQFGALMASNPPAEEFVEKAAEIYVELFMENPDFVKMVAMELFQNPDNITQLMRNLFEEKLPEGGPKLLEPLIRKWYENGEIRECDPKHFMLNAISLSLLSFLAKPLVEMLFQSPFPMENFKEKRIESIVNLLKRGMLK